MKLSLDQIADRFNLNMETLERWIRQGRIPVKIRGGKAIFNESALNKWAKKHKLLSPAKTKTDKQENTENELSLLSAMKNGQVFKSIPGNTKEEILKTISDLTPDVFDESRETLFQQLLIREELNSTGIGKGVAIPHPRNPLE